MKLNACLAALGFVSYAAVARAQPAKSIAIDLGDGTRLEMVIVPKGEETHGSPATEKGRDEDERAHEVVLTSDFYMGKYPVTRRQFAAFVAASSYRTEAEIGVSGGSGWDGKQLVQRKEYTWRAPGFAQTDDDPVTLVTFADAEAFAGWASTKAGRAVMLPTEAQWEHAARGGTKSAFYAGEGDDTAIATGWFKKNAGNGTRPVGTKAPNAFGLYDMGGNVFEWCRDWYAPYPEGRRIDPVALTPSGDKPRRVLRGGSWLKDARWGRSAARYKNTPGSRNADNGFRVVASVEERPAASVATSTPAIPPIPPPVREPPRPPLEPSGVSPIAIVLGGGGLAALLYLLFRRRGGGPAPNGDDISVRAGEDGFWIEGDLPVGTRVKYTCVVRGVEVSDTVSVEGARTFVYTGGVPEQVRILEVTRILADHRRAGGSYRGALPPQAPVRRVVDEPPPFGGFPPAY